MDSTYFTWSADLPSWALVVGALLWAVGVVLLVLEAREVQRGRALLLLSGLLSATLLLLVVARPVRVSSKDAHIGPKVVVLADTSRSMALGQTGEPSRRRAQVRDEVIEQLRGRAGELRLEVRGFAEGKASAFQAGQPDRGLRTDLLSAVRSVLDSADERPQAFVVVSDGNLDDPSVESSQAALASLATELGVPISAVATTKTSPRDAAVRSVASARTAVAHVPFSLRVEVSCSGGLRCADLTVSAKELREDGAPALLATGIANVESGRAVVDLTVTLERAGARTLAISIDTPEGDEIPDNNTRYLSFEVARERVRILHVAGRPTNDVRALRSYLKHNASIDVVAFFILRAPNDYPRASPDELALIPFPVDELFSEHLPSFDAIVLQDFDAQPYGLGRHLPALANYVRAGGGLVMVGGVNSFVAGGYADTPLAAVLPTELDPRPGATSADLAVFEPSWTSMGARARLLGPLREVVGERLPEFSGTNILGDAAPGALVLWTHPTRKTPSGAPMPVLSVADVGDGRAIALGVDGTWALEFSDVGASTAGRGYAALWDGLLGWLMRDPRFEPSRIEIGSSCLAGLPTALRVGPLPDGVEEIELSVLHTDGGEHAPVKLQAKREDDGFAALSLPGQEGGGYVLTAELKAKVGGVKIKRDIACEVGGDEWADSEVHPELLTRLAQATGGAMVAANEVGALRFPKPTVVSSERRVAPVAPAWLWAIAATVAAGVHWIVRRARGLA